MQLSAHPEAPCDAVTRLDADAARDADGTLRFRWRLEGDLRRLRLPAAGAGARTDGLWRATCFEAFIGTGDAGPYLELNFAPSGAWAAYRFDGYRRGMAPLALDAPPPACWQRGPAELALVASLPLLPDTRGALRVALCAVIGTQSGTMSYWAPWHPPGAPDFHHPSARLLELAPAGALDQGRPRTA